MSRTVARGLFAGTIQIKRPRIVANAGDVVPASTRLDWEAGEYRGCWEALTVLPTSHKTYSSYLRTTTVSLGSCGHLLLVLGDTWC